MFTGIIQAKGTVKDISPLSKGAEFVFTSDTLDFSTIEIGDSIAVNGVCLTATKITDNTFVANVSQETLSCSIFSQFKKDQRINLEKALRLNQGIDGHLVSGHVDGIGEVVDCYPEGDSTRIKINVSRDLVKYIARKGSICINGVSLTINNIEDSIFGVNIVPHTFLATTLDELEVGSKVNIEIDIIARHLEQLLSTTENA